LEALARAAFIAGVKFRLIVMAGVVASEANKGWVFFRSAKNQAAIGDRALN
jgi:hypothetical protein